MNSIEQLYPVTSLTVNSAIFRFPIKGQGLEVTSNDHFRTFQITKRNDNLLVVNYNSHHNFLNANYKFRACDTNNFVMIGHTNPIYSYRRNLLLIHKNTATCHKLSDSDNNKDFVEITNNMIYNYASILIFDDLIYSIDNLYLTTSGLWENGGSISILTDKYSKKSILIYHDFSTNEATKLCTGTIEFDTSTKKLTVNSHPADINELIEKKKKENSIYQSYKEDGILKLINKKE